MKRLTLIGIALLLSACASAPQSKYDWGNYEQAMYSYYKQPGNPAELMAALATTIQQAEANKRTVAPGLYAEYGYLNMMAGNTQEALANFDKEKRKWPASAQLMDKMSKMAQVQSVVKAEAKQ